jgi:DNA mismatch repair protein MutS
MASLYDEYENYVKKAKEDYGPETVVLYRCGQFYEIYAIDDGLVDIKAISDLLNIQVSRRNKAILEVNRSNALMAGFPMFALRKFVTLLLQKNYTVVIVDQITPPPKPKRAITEVISPGTNIECDSGSTGNACNYMMTLFIEDLQDWKSGKTNIGVGCALIDITTGVSHVYEAYSKPHDTNYALDEVYRLMSSYNPAEIIITGKTDFLFEELCTQLEISHNKCVHNKLNLYPADLDKLAFQNMILSKVYHPASMLSLLEYLDLERLPLATKAFVYIVMFAQKHNADLLTKIERPSIIQKGNILQLHFNAAKQLNITNGLMGILNNTCTAIGKRGFMELLFAPFTAPEVLNRTYDNIQSLLMNKSFLGIRKALSNVCDLSRVMRKMYMQKLQPMEMMYFDGSLQSIVEVIQLIKQAGLILDITINEDCVEAVQSFYRDSLVLDTMAKYNIETIEESFFTKGVYEEVDELQGAVNVNMQVFHDLVDKLGPFFKLDYNERDGYYLLITAKRFKETKFAAMYQCQDHAIESKHFSSKPVSTSSANVKIHHPIFGTLSDKIVALKAKLKSAVTNKFKAFIHDFVTSHDDALHTIIRFVQDVDILTTHAYNAETYRYYRPTLADKYNGRSFIDAKEMRHPVVEVYNKTTCFVANDVAFTPDHVGMLLFGLNCSGKTTLSKAVALNVIMAQIGSFVPSKRMEFYPYCHIFTRIPSGDDMLKALSTFAVEMTELRNILKRADDQSLIVGDEVSHGTEVTSGVAIVGAAICELTRRGSHFIFATHIHDIVDVPRVRDLDGVRMCHMSVHFDHATGQLVYDRKLKPGSGDSVYGLEVCKALDMPQEFLDLAYEIRNGGREVVPHTSRYSKDVYMQQPCQICGQMMQEVHHIHQQAHAESDGFIRDTHIRKNAPYNLVAVCAKCHDDIHAHKIVVQGYVQTNQGVVLDHKTAPKAMDTTRDAAIKDMIIELRQQRTSFPKIHMMLMEKGYDVSMYRIKKLFKNVVCNL